MINTFYSIKTEKNLPHPIKIALLADLHNCDPSPVLESLASQKPDLIAFAGDSVNGSTAGFDSALELMRQASLIAPLFYSAGNHDVRPEGPFMARAAKTGAVILDCEYRLFKGVAIGGIGYNTGHDNGKCPRNEKFLQDFSLLENFKILLWHIPSYYPIVRPYDIDMMLAGHAHGGQWRFFGRGIYAPHQGFFPKYTSGVHENRLVISRGLGDTTRLARINNPHETVYITVENR